MNENAQKLIDEMLAREPDLGAGDVSKCLPGWIESFCQHWNDGEKWTLSRPAIGNLLHTLLAARQRAARLVSERNELRAALMSVVETSHESAIVQDIAVLHITNGQYNEFRRLLGEQ